MNQTKKVIIQKEQLLTDFSQLSEWLQTYWYFLENLPLDIFVDTQEVIHHLRNQHHHLLNAKLKLQTIDMIGATVQFALEHMQASELVFHLPVHAPKEVAGDYKEIANLAIRIEDVENSLQQLVHQVIYLSENLPEQTTERISPILRTIASFFKAIVRKDMEDMEVELNQINLLTATKDGHLLIQEIGKMTRDIYNSLQDLSVDLNAEGIRHVTDKMPDAVEKLYSVIQRLEDAANDNLDFLENLLQQCEQNIELLETTQQGLQGAIDGLQHFSDSHQEISMELQPILDQLQSNTQQQISTLLNNIHNEETTLIAIMSNQGFQDLTGQTLKKIIDFMEQLELRLLELIQKYSSGLGSTEGKPIGLQMSRVDVGIEGEEINLHGPDEVAEQKSTQGDVDSLLAEMGF